MPAIGPIPMLSDEFAQVPSGAAFLLASRPSSDALHSLDSAQLEVRQGSPYAVVRFGSATSAADAFTIGHTVVQQGLDMMSILGLADLVIRDAEDEHLVWWTDSNGLALRAVSTILLKFSVAPVTITVTEKNGRIVPPSPHSPRHHVAFRFFRLAQTTDDLFDAYRNMYLAFEALLSTQYPKQATEREINWLRRGLRSSSTALRFDTLGLPHSDDLVEAILGKVYTDARLPLFHAKDGQTYFPPQDTPTSRKAVAAALALLTNIVLRMAESWFDARRLGGGVFFGWVYENVQSLLRNCTAYASSYEAPFDPAEEDLSHPRFATAARLQCRLAPELQRGREPAVLSVAVKEQLAKANPLMRVELASDSAPTIGHTLEAPIHLDGIHQLEDLMHIRGSNANQPRSLYRQ